MRYLDPCTAYTVKECEMIELSSPNFSWKALPGMIEARYSFNPCLFSDYVYLCGYPSNLVEAFSPQTDSFLPLPLQLPESSPSCVYVHKNCLVVFSYNYITTFFAGQASQLLPHSQARCPAGRTKWCNSQPVLDPTHSLVFLFQWSQCVSFDMETGAPVAVFPT